MAAGFVKGLIWGSVVSVAGLSLWSLSAPLPPRPEVITEPPGEVEQGVVPETEESQVDGPGPDADLVEIAPTAPGAGGAAPEPSPSEDTADKTSAPLPDVGPATGGLDEPAATADGGIDVDGEQPATQAQQSATPQTPSEEVELSISTDPAQPAQPEIVEEGAFGAPEPETGSEVETPSATQPPATAGSGAPASEPDPDTAALPDTSTPEAPVENVEPPLVSDLPQVGAAPEEEQVATAEEPVEDRPERSGRLPSIGDEEEQPDLSESAEVPDLPLAPPLERFAEPFENPEDKPLMSIVLIDDAESLGAEALADFPYPLTFAIDPVAPGAVEKMRRHRDAGFEVAALIDLPVSATPSDAEVALSAGLGTLSEAVAILEGTGTGFQGNRALSDQVAAIALASGHGLITQDKGLNTALKLALREGVPAAGVFRDFDGAGQTPTVMRRFLDQAAFRARRDGAVIMLGRVRPDTVSALLLWGLQDRAPNVALAPVSAVLSPDEES